MNAVEKADREEYYSSELSDCRYCFVALNCQMEPLELRTVAIVPSIFVLQVFLDQRQTRLHVQQSRDYNRLAFRYNPADDYSLSPHVLIGTTIEIYPYCKTLKLNGEKEGMS
ncbi:unnamed protein product [Onchocerca ochengi]|uniref:DUF3395 domain-containing protein n=1 Tax=Onchocerca ochengi TaxID=42157 RepID=A0A182E7L1_ONCOC|nr:unnamed protein product [Onchocerca ochengi]